MSLHTVSIIATIVTKWGKHDPASTNRQTPIIAFTGVCLWLQVCVCEYVCLSMAWKWLLAVLLYEHAKAAPIHYPVNTAWARAIIVVAFWLKKQMHFQGKCVCCKLSSRNLIFSFSFCICFTSYRASSCMISLSLYTNPVDFRLITCWLKCRLSALSQDFKPKCCINCSGITVIFVHSPYIKRHKSN